MPSYLSLRVCPKSSAASWWDAARQRHDAPPAIAALLKGRGRVEVTPDEAALALDWAGDLAGWSAADPKPIWLYHPVTTVAGG